MNVDNLPDLNPPAFGDVRDPGHPILSFAWHSPAPHRAAAHSHIRAHIIQPEVGTFWVVTPEGTWLVPTGEAIWIPPLVYHEVYSQGEVSARMLFVDQAFADPLPKRCGTVKVSMLLGELIERAVSYGNDYAPDGAASRLAQVLLDELAVMEIAPLLLPISKDDRLANAMKILIDDPAAQDSLEDLSRKAGASARTLARLFRTETGMSFKQWKTRLVLIEAIERLSHGASVTEVALDLGYSTTSSFVYMFRSNLGVSPGNYRDSTRT
ncbi:MAG: helix-turn-helix domain-containing protein [Blastocatellales bacterium]|nr:helix-turn-helix transcriptional regulator [Nitrosomonas nitrosa]